MQKEAVSLANINNELSILKIYEYISGSLFNQILHRLYLALSIPLGDKQKLPKFDPQGSGVSSAERRKSERFRAEIPIELQHGTGITRDCCIDGVFFKTDQNLSVGDQIEFVMNLEYAIQGDRSVKLRCRGEVLRVEPGLGNRGCRQHEFSTV